MSCLCSSHQFSSSLFIVNVVKELIIFQREIQCLYSLLKVMLHLFFSILNTNLIDVLELREKYRLLF